MFFGLYVLVLMFLEFYVMVMGVYFGMGVLIVLILFVIGYDFVYNVVFFNQKVNYFMGYIWNFFGISSYFWCLKYNVFYYVFINILGSDGDLD